MTNLKSQNTGKTQLIASESPVTVEILLHKVPISGNMKRKVIPLVKPIRDKKATEICVFVRDAKIAKEKLNSASAPNIKKVIALNKLRTHYNQYEARRVLAQSYDLFLCESTILPDVCRQLGTSFLRIRKYVCPTHIFVIYLRLRGLLVRALDSNFCKIALTDLVHFQKSPLSVPKNLQMLFHLGLLLLLRSL